jgi:hypothetical protein
VSDQPNREMSLLSIDREVLVILGKTADEIAAMSCGEFAELSYSKGIKWRVAIDGGRIKGLTIHISKAAT